ncbi:MAG: helix-turn-helix transcriptional regulator [Candidatus Nanohaloarchaeota archaeon QJJ-5]|nr:helix-turn-helix transcriptional regulator [Candidatus Nanohaloarchaeota archaeon QJJ-5]
MTQNDILPEWCQGEEWCPVTATGIFLSGKWKPVIIHHLLEEDDLRFNELQKAIGTISNKVLSDNLDDLEEKNLINRQVDDGRPVEVRYSLTKHGENLEPVITEMRRWAQQYKQDTDI